MIYDLPSDEVLQDGALAGRLAPDDGDLRQIELHVDAELSERILQLVHDGDEVFHPAVARHGDGRGFAPLALAAPLTAPLTAPLAR